MSNDPVAAAEIQARQGDRRLVRCARWPGMRALAWSNDLLYASRGYQLFSARIRSPYLPPTWQLAGTYRAAWNRRLTAGISLTSRFFREGFHAVAVLPDGGLVAAVRGAILSLRSGDTELRRTHVITRGTRPLHIVAVPIGTLFWGEYFDNAPRDEVHIYASTDRGQTWNIAYTFPKRAIRHIHNIVHDPWGDCLWIFTGDYGEECRILRAACDLSSMEVALQGNQQARAVAAIPTPEGVYFSSDTPLEQNYIYRLDRNGNLSQVARISSSSIYSCRVGTNLFFSTMVEPSAVNRDRKVRIYEVNAEKSHSVLEWKKDSWPMRFFQYGNAFLPDGNNTTPYLAVSTIAVCSDDQVTSLYAPQL